MSKLLKIPDVMELLGLSRTQVYGLKREIGFIKLGRVIRFRKEDVDAYIESRFQGKVIRRQHKKKLAATYFDPEKYS